MIYVVTQQILPESKKYEVITIEESLRILENLQVVGLDTETMGLDPYTHELVMLQLGCEDFQVVIDITTIDIEFYRKYLESDRLFIGWNIKFDLKFLYHKRIVPNKVYDGFLAEKLMWLGYPSGVHSMSLKSAGQEYLGIELDKSVRGKIIWAGLSEDVIEYGANDVKYLEDIMIKQKEKLREKNLLTAIEYENESVFWVAYTEYCGLKLDKEKWAYKMVLDNLSERVFRDALNNWIIAACTGQKYAYHYLQIEGLSDKDLKQSRASMEGERCPEADIKGDIRGYFEAWKVPVNAKLSTSKYVNTNPQGDLFSGFQTDSICTIKWTSPKQVVDLLNDLGFDLLVEDKETGEFVNSVKAEVIEKQRHISTIAYLYVRYKEIQKVVSTYGQNMIDQINSRSGRVHTNFNQLGTDTARLSSGSADKDKIKRLNFQNFPADAETRSCFVAEPGMKWISMDYKGQENRILAEITGDKELLDLFNTGCGDFHSLITKVSYPNIVDDCPIEDIKSKFGGVRREAKGIGFTITYGGDSNTIAKRNDIPIEEASEIYNRCMNRFTGIKVYQDYQRRFVMNNGYIILNSKTGHKAYIYDYDILMNMKKRFDNDFWNKYRSYKGKENKRLPKSIKAEIYQQLANGDDIESIIGERYITKKNAKGIAKIVKVYHVSKADVYVHAVKHYYKERKPASEKQAINYPCQGTGALVFKLASIFIWKYLKENDLLFKVKMCAPVHDEWNIEVPEDIVLKMVHIIEDCMERAGRFFCKKVRLSVSSDVGDYWIH